jgi:opacity protein-like surface antigen
MKRILTTAALLALIAPLAHAATAENADAKALRAECATQHAVKFDEAAGANEYRFVYNRGEYRGEATAGQSVACGQTQYVEYLASADPVRVMTAYPTAAGRPQPAKKAAK